MLAKQPVAIVALVVVALQAIQEAAIEGLPLAVHIAISVAIIIGGVLVARSKVSPIHLGPEPVAIIGAIVAGLQAVQQAVINPPGVRIAVTLLVVGLGAVLATSATQTASQ